MFFNGLHLIYEKTICYALPILISKNTEAFNMNPGLANLFFFLISMANAHLYGMPRQEVFYGINSFYAGGLAFITCINGKNFICTLWNFKIRLRSIGPANNIYAGGGFIKSKQWVSLLADVVGKRGNRYP